jgi:hypothetical protein
MEAVGPYRPLLQWLCSSSPLGTYHHLFTMATKAKSDVKVLKGQGGKVQRL